jgi:hypothetical protein
MASLDGMLSFFAHKTAESQTPQLPAPESQTPQLPAPEARRTRKSRWDTGVDAKAEVCKTKMSKETYKKTYQGRAKET